MISWKSKYEIGIEKIDFEHKTFLSLIVDFKKQIESPSLESYIVNRAKEILKYAEFHFLSEENLMNEISFPQRVEHHYLHQKLLEDLTFNIESLVLKIMAPEQFLDFLLNWFVAHTTQEDLRIAKFIKNEYYE